MSFDINVVIAFVIAAVIVFGIMFYKIKEKEKGISMKDALASKIIKTAQGLVDKYEVEIKAYDTEHGTTYWEDLNTMLAKMYALLTDEDIGIMGYIQAILDMEPEIEKIMKDVGLIDKD
ncbi:MAG: hypothetical protein M0R51_14730 [Clostridia bacterium]|jgi:hypothetical protein|nr:hypothetical protein [Clostridia bacterium]